MTTNPMYRIAAHDMSGKTREKQRFSTLKAETIRVEANSPSVLFGPPGLRVGMKSAFLVIPGGCVSPVSMNHETTSLPEAIGVSARRLDAPMQVGETCFDPRERPD